VNEGVLEAARVIRPYLKTLVGPAADDLDGQIAELLAAAGRGEEVAAVLGSLMARDEATAAFLDEVLADAPLYRPPEVQPDYLRSAAPPPGDVGTVLHAGKYACPGGDYVWYRPAISVPIPECPTHGPGLSRA
jgi:hypothetical protein